MIIQAQWITMFADCTLASTPLSKVIRGHHQDLLE